MDNFKTICPPGVWKSWFLPLVHGQVRPNFLLVPSWDLLVQSRKSKSLWDSSLLQNLFTWYGIRSKLSFTWGQLTPSSIYKYTNFNTLKKKAFGKHCGKRWNCSSWAISPLSTMFSMQSVSKNHLIATFQMLSAASLDLGWSQNDVIGNGLKVANQLA